MRPIRNISQHVLVNDVVLHGITPLPPPPPPHTHRVCSVETFLTFSGIWFHLTSKNCNAHT